jgi:rod shape-determining protein MreC
MLNLIRRRILLISFGVVLATLMALLSLRWRDPEQGWLIDEVIQALAYPVIAGYHGVVQGAGNLIDRYSHLVHVEQENERLRLQVQALQEELNHHINGSIQFNLLREQLKFLEENPETKVFAEVIGESVDNFHHVLVINKGSLAGIRRNFPVVLREGVVGRIQSVTATQALVELITDRRHRFPGLIQRTRERAIVGGDEDQLRLSTPDRGMVYGTGRDLQLNRVRMLADVQPGDRVVTSGLSGIFPKGLLVGTISNVYRERHELFQSADIEPVVDFNKIEWVFVILRDSRDEDYPQFTRP